MATAAVEKADVAMAAVAMAAVVAATVAMAVTTMVETAATPTTGRGDRDCSDSVGGVNFDDCSRKENGGDNTVLAATNTALATAAAATATATTTTAVMTAAKVAGTYNNHSKPQRKKRMRRCW